MTFQDLLNGAIARGQAPCADSGLGPATFAAIELIAREHPDAPVELILDAYDAFRVEHG